MAGRSLTGCSALGAAGGYIGSKEITGERWQKGGLYDETSVSVGSGDLTDDRVITVAEERAASNIEIRSVEGSWGGEKERS